jgi:hypothetical protein
LCHLLWPESRAHSGWIALAMASQLALLKDAFVTMTEIPAAFCLVLALYLQLARGRPWLAALALGCVPLCRVEMLPTCAFIALYWAWHDKRIWALALTGLPGALWFGAAALATHELTWFRHASYASLRAWGIAGVVRYNALAGLAAVMSAPALLLFCLGLIEAPRALPRSHAWLLIGALACHYATLNVLDVFPNGVEGVPRGHAVAAINARNYSCTAPIATLFICLGIARWHTARRRALGWALACSAAALVLGRIGSPALLALDCALIGLLFGCMRQPERAWKLAAISCMAGALLVRPFFWYPTRWNDQRALAIAALAARARTAAPARIVQDVASALAFFGQLRGIDADWTWPTAFPARLEQAPNPSWLVTEVDPSGSLLTRYPSELRVCMDEPLAGYDSPVEPAWLNAIDRLAGRNRPVHWRAYTVTAACRSQLR